MRILHTEFQSNNAEATSDFLTAMLGLPARQEATQIGPLFTLQADAETTLSVRTKQDHERAPGTTVYFETEDVSSSLLRAEALGATVIVPKMTFAGRGYIGWVEAPGSVYMAFLQVDASVSTTGEAAE